ncbi:hypothetical protein [Actinacidiphila oryziradicis]|uniref:hypothetical protein n=1 Tax=Actinacidiphila oryziradicis TaxID=2571141 RepID=UPI002AFFF6BB|nr:hypothetical protein [Actinacidiphila oryziradicis]
MAASGARRAHDAQRGDEDGKRTGVLRHGMVFALFGAGLLLWSARCVMRNVPVAQHAGPVAAVIVTACGAISLLVGVWCFLRV